jgi:hypothetical protein
MLDLIAESCPNHPVHACKAREFMLTGMAGLAATTSIGTALGLA